ncbi:MAG: endonuclease III [Syntrophus sp. (in: bacteria)]|nr:endonuclease III [Syntrophus sp. (in: bacteria)]
MKHRQLSPKQISSFQSTIYRYFTEHGRDLPWRNTNDPYCILVSEMMLQQTQVERVMEKYGLFLSRFPDFVSLAKATLREILVVWQGLGYNRRAMSLMKLAQVVVTENHGKLPANLEALVKLPGIGRATAGSILAFAFHEPSVFIETNIRRVFIHHFFQDREDVHDDEIMALVEVTLDRSNPRDWYYALMDYGSMLKKQIANPNKKSAHYTRQSPFEDSDRKIRGAILKALVRDVSMTEEGMTTAIGGEKERMKNILSALVKEGFIVKRDKTYCIV